MKIRHVAAEKIGNGIFTETLNPYNFSSSKNCGPAKVAARELVEFFNRQQRVKKLQVPHNIGILTIPATNDAFSNIKCVALRKAVLNNFSFSVRAVTNLILT